MVRNYHFNNIDAPDIDCVVTFLNSSVNKCLNFEQLAEIVDKRSSICFDPLPCNNLLNRLIVGYNIHCKHFA